MPRAEILLVDKNPEVVKYLRKRGFKAFQDDITNPRLHLYRGADLIYSVHPPPELLPYLIRLAERVKAALLVKPLSEDAYLAGLDPGWKIDDLYLLVPGLLDAEDS